MVVSAAMDPNVAGKRLLIKQINKLPLHADFYFCCSLLGPGGQHWWAWRGAVGLEGGCWPRQPGPGLASPQHRRVSCGSGVQRGPWVGWTPSAPLLPGLAAEGRLWLV